MPSHQNIASMFFWQAKQYENQAALSVKQNGVYSPISWNEFLAHVAKIANGLRKIGIQKGDRVALLSENRPEWAYVDLAVLGIGAITVPIYATSSTREIEYVLEHSSSKVLFVSTLDQLNKLDHELVKKLTCKVIQFDGAPGDFSLTLKEFENQSEAREAVYQFEKGLSDVKLNDPATIIYTSGTTGPPKGVVLSHLNFLTNAEDASEAVPLDHSDVTLSFLPLSHVFERLAGFYYPMMQGCTISYAENMNTVPENLLEVRPTMACAVPRLYEKIYAKVKEKIEKSSPVMKKIISWALRVGKEHMQYRLRKESPPFAFRAKYKIADILVFSKLRKQLGGRLRFFISGGAPLAKELGEFFYAAGVTILEGYGLTETSPVITVNRLDHIKFGTVGLPFRHAEIKIAADGEILTRGPSVMVGYYQDEKATQEVIQSGWFHTGDIGLIDSEGFLVITDRKKDIIVTSGGKNVAPQNIENLCKQSLAIQQMVVLGDRHHYLVALVVPNFEYVSNKLGLGGLSREKFISHDAVCALIRSEIDYQTKDLANYEKIKYFKLLPEELSLAKGEITPTLKVKRKVIMERYADLIRRMYDEGEKR